MYEPWKRMPQPYSYSTKRYDFEVLAVIVNYNSKPFLAIEKILLKGLADLGRYTKIKLLLVDNYSTDGSFEELKEHLKRLGVDTDAVGLSKNYGFARAVNIAWHYAFKRWKFRYLMLLNNDLVIVPSNVVKLLKYLEIDNVAGVQGTILQADNPHIVDNAGFAIDTFGLTYPICRGYTVECAKVYHPSFLSGAFSVYRADAIEKLGQPFHNAVEAYFDDKYLGLRLWSAGYKLLHVPLVVAYHLGSASYATRRKLRSSQWFKGVMLSELAPSYIAEDSSFILLVVAFGILSVFLSLFLMVNIVKSFVRVCKKLRMLKNSSSLIDRNKIPMINFTLKLDRLKYGVAFKHL